MAYCKNCGAELQNGAKFCPSCGSRTDYGRASAQADFSERISELNNTADTTSEFDANDIENNMAMAILSYLSWLVLIPLLAAKNSKFARYHANQGLVLAIAELAFGVAYGIVSAIILAISLRLAFIVSIIGLLGLVFLALSIIGIVNAANGRAKELPIIGKIKLIK